MSWTKVAMPMPKGDPGVYIDELGSFYSVDDGVLIQIPALEDGTPDLNENGEFNKVEVTSIEEQSQLDHINHALGTNFKLSDFPGRP